ncbi:MAG: ABC transporter permease [Verrucomicrobiales bacterium]
MSRLPFELLLALRYLRPKRTFVSVITLISIIGVMLGVAVLIIVISVMTGFDRELRDKILGFNAHIRVGAVFGKRITDAPQLMEEIRKNPRVKAVAPFVLGQALIETQPEFGDSVYFAQYIRGIDPKLESAVSILPTSVTNGTFDLKGYKVLVGRGLAETYNLQVGDRLLIYSPHDLRQMRESLGKGEEEATLQEDYFISGIFDVGHYEYNSAFVVTSIANAQTLYGLNDAVSGLFVMLNDPYDAASVRAELGKSLGGSVYMSTWQEENSTFLDALVVEKNVMFYLLFFIMIVAAFGIMSALITFVVQKTREIGMLKALGATSRQIMIIFLSQSFIVGVLGVAAGLGLGILAVEYRNEFLALMRQATGFQLFPEQIYVFSKLPALIVPKDIFVICGGSLIICMLAGLVPAWNAGRLKPVEALRHE